MKRFVLIGLLLTILLSLAGCEVSSDWKQSEQQEQILKNATDKVGMPNIHNFFERETLRKIYEMRDNPALATYAYKEQMNGKFIYIGRAIGYGIPYATQFTSPQKLVGQSVLPQADPNGLFSPHSAEATWLILVNEQTNEPEVLYFEPRLVISQHKLPRRLVEEWSLPPNY